MVGPQVLQSEAVHVFCALEDAGVTVAVQADGRLQLDHADGVPLALVAAVRAHREHVVLLAAWQLPEVQRRYHVFDAQLAQADEAVVLPVLFYQAGVDWRRGTCWSCGHAIEPARCGRCFACRAAWSLLMNQPMPAQGELPAERAQGAA